MVRRAVEDAAQDWLERYYRDRGWLVEDVRHEKRGFDALATRGDEELYLEAKGTLTSGLSVIVTRHEVDVARRNQGRYVLGILSGVRLTADGGVDPTNGVFRRIDWSPDDGTLVAREYDWMPERP